MRDIFSYRLGESRERTMDVLRQAVDVISEQGGWKPPRPDTSGAYDFAFEDGVSMRLFSPDKLRVVFSATVLPLATDEHERAEVAERAANLGVAAMKKRRSILSLVDGALCLHRPIRAAGFTPTEIRAVMPIEARDFLNDLAWWRACLAGEGRAEASSSPFSMAGIRLP